MEREIKGERSEKEIYFKFLHLITPEHATKHAILTEAPVFISPQESGGRICDICHQPRKAVIYSARTITEGHDFHRHKKRGGIYYQDAQPDRFQEALYRHSDEEWFNCWIAILEPLGDRVRASLPLYPDRFMLFFYQKKPPLISTRVYVKEIFAICAGLEYCFPNILSSGFVVSPSPDSPFLYPMCSRHTGLVEGATPRYSFITREGSVLFSDLEKSLPK